MSSLLIHRMNELTLCMAVVGHNQRHVQCRHSIANACCNAHNVTAVLFWPPMTERSCSWLTAQVQKWSRTLHAHRMSSGMHQRLPKFWLNPYASRSATQAGMLVRHGTRTTGGPAASLRLFLLTAVDMYYGGGCKLCQLHP